MADELAVWLYASCVATVASDRRGPRLTYTDEACRRYAPGTPLLSLSLPVRTERFPKGIARPFLDGLLPEGESRRIIARRVGVDVDDTHGLINALGRDCAGAIVIQPMEESGPPPSTTTTAEPLSDEQLADLVRNLRSAPLGASGRVRISLAGVQDKLLLTRMPDGTWGRPVDGTPSTHILKPEIAAYPNTVENEAFCMRIAKHLGLQAASVETTEVAGRRLVVVERYDRMVRPDGTVERIHEDRMEHRGGLRERCAHVDRLDELEKADHELADDACTGLNPVCVADAGQGHLDLLTEMPGDPVGCLGRPEGARALDQLGIQAIERGPKTLGDQHLVETWRL